MIVFTKLKKEELKIFGFSFAFPRLQQHPRRSRTISTWWIFNEWTSACSAATLSCSVLSKACNLNFALSGDSGASFWASDIANDPQTVREKWDVTNRKKVSLSSDRTSARGRNELFCAKPKRQGKPTTVVFVLRSSASLASSSIFDNLMHDTLYERFIYRDSPYTAPEGQHPGSNLKSLYTNRKPQFWFAYFGLPQENSSSAC